MLTDEQTKSILDAAAQHSAEGNNQAAARAYASILREDPDNGNAIANMSHVLTVARHFKAAVALGRKAVELHPEHAGPLRNLGKALWCLGEDGSYEEAQKYLEKSSELDSGVFVVWHALGLVYHFQGDTERALECYDNALAIAPKSPQSVAVRQDVALCHMREGLWAEGLKEFECRWEFPTVIRHPVVYAMPEWKGEPVDGKTIVIVHEQGVGDSIQFARFAQNLLDLGANVTFVVPPALVRLFKFRLPGVLVWNGESGAIPEGDYWVPSISVFRWLGEMAWDDCHGGAGEPESKDEAFRIIIEGKPYLSRHNVDAVMPMLDIPQDKFRVGIVWGGLIGQDSDRRRSAPLETFLGLAEIPGVTLVSLQYGERDRELDLYGVEPFVYRAMEGVRDYEDTARLIQQLDLVISVDTSVVHLAGALGIRTFVLTDYMCCWRWQRDRMDSIWYDSVTVFRKERPGTFDGVMARVCAAVRAMVAERADLASRRAALANGAATLPNGAIDAEIDGTFVPVKDSHDEWRALNEMLDNPPPPNAALIDLIGSPSPWSETQSAEVGQA